MPLRLGVAGLFFRPLARCSRFGQRFFRARDLLDGRRFVARFARRQVVEVRRSFRREAGKRVEPVAARGEPVLRGQQAFGSPRRGRKIGLAPLPSLGQLADRTRDLVHVLDRAAFGFGVLLTRHG